MTNARLLRSHLQHSALPTELLLHAHSPAPGSSTPLGGLPVFPGRLRLLWGCGPTAHFPSFRAAIMYQGGSHAPGLPPPGVEGGGGFEPPACCCACSRAYRSTCRPCVPNQNCTGAWELEPLLRAAAYIDSGGSHALGPSCGPVGGADRIRTGGPLVGNQLLSHLRYRAI